jgi:hypothetical protein
MTRRTTRLVRFAGVAVLPALSGCLPIPNRVTDAVEVSGLVLSAGRPLPGARVSVEQPDYVGPGDPGPCSGASPVVSDASGRFHSPRRRKWHAWVSLVGESPEWHIPIRLCLGEPEGWRELYLTAANGWDPPLVLTCDVADAPARDPLTGTRGQCRVAAAVDSLAR